MTDQDKVLQAVRNSYTWAKRDNPHAEVCPNCNGVGKVTVFGQTITCPCQEPKSQTPTPRRGLPQVIEVKSPRVVPRVAIATSDPRYMDVAIEPLSWLYDEITIQLHGCVLGMTGSGKTNTVYRIVEQILRAKGIMTIIDPEGDYRHLKSQYPILIAGKGRKGNPIDLVVSPDSAYLLARKLASRSVSVILDLSGYDEEAKNVFVESYVGEIWKQYQDENLPPMRLVLDEVQLFAPQNTNTDSKKLILDIASRGRKRHLALLIATQRPQRVDKTLLDATDIRVFHRLKRGSALNAVRELLPFQIGDVKGKEIDNIFANMLRGQATFEMEGQEPCLVTIKPSDTYHPQTGPLTQLSIPLQTLDAELLAELRRDLDGSPNVVINPEITFNRIADPRIATLETENQQLRKLLEEKEAEIAALKLPPNVSLLSITHTTDSTEYDGRSPLATARAVTKQQREFNQFLNSLAHQHSGAQRAMFKFLIQNDANKYGLHEIARFSGYSVSTLSKLPQRLIAGGYIWRQKGRKPIFQSTVRSRLAQMYPDLNIEALVGEILKACK